MVLVRDYKNFKQDSSKGNGKYGIELRDILEIVLVGFEVEWKL